MRGGNLFAVTLFVCFIVFITMKGTLPNYIKLIFESTPVGAINKSFIGTN